MIEDLENKDIFSRFKVEKYEENIVTFLED